MKCSYCGKELPAGAEFCPECGMILSLGGAVEEKEAPAEAEVEIPEYTPNVFQAMDFEEEVSEPARELEATDVEEEAPVVEIIPEHVNEQEAEIAPEAEAEAPVPEMAEQEIFAVPEYDPNKAVSPEFVEELEREKALNASTIQVEDVPDEQATIKFTPPAEPPEIIRVEIERPEPAPAPVEYEEPAYEAPAYEPTAEEYAPEEPAAEEAAYEQEPEYEAEPAAQYEVAETDEDDYTEPAPEGEIYPVYSDETAEAVPEANPYEDNSLIEALFDGMTEDAEEEIEDITHTYNEKKTKKKSKNGFGVLFALVVVLVGIIFAAGYVVDNVFPEIKDKLGFTTTFPTTSGNALKDDSESTTESTTEGTTESTTESTTADSGSTTKPTTTKAPVTDIFGDEVRTEPSTTEKVTTTKAPETTKKPTTTKAPETTQDYSSTVEEPSYYNMYETAYFPYDDIRLKTRPSSSAATVINHPYGYPLYAYAIEDGYYYVHSPYHDVMGWVDADDVYEYEPTTQQSTTSGSSSSSGSGYVDYASPYSAMIMSTTGLNFRTGPGTDYGVSVVVPGGFYVTVYGYSETNPGWVYITVEDSRYPYASPSGWVSESYLG